MKKIIVLIMAIYFSENMVAQQRCGNTYENMLQIEQIHPELRQNKIQVENEIQKYISGYPKQKLNTVVTIPVVFHVLNYPGQLFVSDTKIKAQLKRLNEDYSNTNSDNMANNPDVNMKNAFLPFVANTNIQFCLAQRKPNGDYTTGIIRKPTSNQNFYLDIFDDYNGHAMKYDALGGDNIWDPSKYLNIWICNLSGCTNVSNCLGYGQYPGSVGSNQIDGIVLKDSVVGGPGSNGIKNHFDLGRTATHEIGHWLDLYHIGEYGIPCYNDLVADTREQTAPNTGCPIFPRLSIVCYPFNSYPGDMFMNYMDYVYDNCMFMFTQGQSNRMNATLQVLRTSILTSDGCTPGIGCAPPINLTNTNLTTTSGKCNWDAQPNATYYKLRYKAVGTTTWSYFNPGVNSKTLTGLLPNTQYQWSVKCYDGTAWTAFSVMKKFKTKVSAFEIETEDTEYTEGKFESVEDHAMNDQLDAEIFPNPVTDFLSINLNHNAGENYRITLCNPEGKTVYSKTSGLTAEIIDMSELSAGMYFLNITDNSKNYYATKVIKK